MPHGACAARATAAVKETRDTCDCCFLQQKKRQFYLGKQVVKVESIYDVSKVVCMAHAGTKGCSVHEIVGDCSVEIKKERARATPVRHSGTRRVGEAC